MSALEADFSLEEAAQILKLKPQQLRNLANSAQIGHIKTGRTLTFPTAAIVAYREAHTVTPLPSNPHGLTSLAARRVRA